MANNEPLFQRLKVLFCTSLYLANFKMSLKSTSTFTTSRSLLFKALLQEKVSNRKRRIYPSDLVRARFCRARFHDVHWFTDNVKWRELTRALKWFLSSHAILLLLEFCRLYDKQVSTCFPREIYPSENVNHLPDYAATTPPPPPPPPRSLPPLPLPKIAYGPPLQGRLILLC